MPKKERPNKVMRAWVGLTEANRDLLASGWQKHVLAACAEADIGNRVPVEDGRLAALAQIVEYANEARNVWLPAHRVLGPKNSLLYDRRRMILRRNSSSIRSRPPISSRTGQPRPDRLEIHAGDWVTFLARCDPSTFNLVSLPISSIQEFAKMVDRLRDANEAKKKRG
jgi:hypothetical protein